MRITKIQELEWKIQEHKEILDRILNIDSIRKEICKDLREEIESI